MKLFSWFLEKTNTPANSNNLGIKTDNNAMWPTAGVRKTTIYSTTQYSPTKKVNISPSIVAITKLKPNQA